MTSAQALGLVVAVAGVVALGLAAVFWRTRRARRLARTITIDLRTPMGRTETSYFHLTLDQRMASSRRHLQPLSLVLFELNGFERARPELRDQGLLLLSGVLRRTLRECDTACRYDETTVAALLEDTPEAGAVAAVERVRRSMTSSPVTRSFSLSAGIACYPTHALDAAELLHRAVQARDHVETAGTD